MTPQIVPKGQTWLVGFSFYGDPFRLSPGWTEENEIGRLWQRFMAFLASLDEAARAFIARPGIAYEVHVYNEETRNTGLFEVFVGIELAAGAPVPLETVVKVLPATTYAVFTLRGQEIVGDWSLAIYGEWLPESGYELAHQYHIQYHDGSFKGFDHLDKSSLDVYVPIRLKA